ncbi:hypothetical protein OIO90_005676 [Microbotryomycetes sp. JL221]|nr:hypothetical protein OIO90_005676 [Microbotryomycetes sp. JL221]
MALTPSNGPQILSRTRSGTLSTELDEASTNLMHLSLDIHDEREAMHRGEAKHSALTRRVSNRVSRVKSVEDLRIPPMTPLGPAGQPTTNNAQADELIELEQDEMRRGTTASKWNLNVTSGPLLRRITSAEQMLDLDQPDDELDDVDDFTSDEEPYKCKPPSIASSATSQRSSFLGIRVEDHSAERVDAFAREVKITGYHPVGSQDAAGFVVFDIAIRTREGAELRIHRRYSAFVRLRKELLLAHPELKACVPPLPPKSSFSKYRASFLEKRRQQLSFWLSTVLLHPLAGASAVVRQWVLE